MVKRIKMVKRMKIKRFVVVRIPTEVEYIRTIVGRVYLFLNFYKLIKIQKIYFEFKGFCESKPIYRVYIPKINAK